MDTNGNGQIDLTSAQDGVDFDITGTGKKERVAWTKANGDKTDGLLVLPDAKGNVTNGKQLFGNQWGDANGFERLKQFDQNHDGALNQQDAAYSQLRTWQDKDHDGKVDPGELKTLQEAGVQSINLNYSESAAKDAAGNELRQQGAFQRTDAEANEIAKNQGISPEQAKNGSAVDAWFTTAAK